MATKTATQKINDAMNDDDQIVVLAEGSYKLSELRTAFERVENPTNWKRAIDATIIDSLEGITLVKEAITFFVGGKSTMYVVASETREGKTMLAIRFVNAGYYENIGA
jgi:hypothetical protein